MYPSSRLKRRPKPKGLASKNDPKLPALWKSREMISIMIPLIWQQITKNEI